MGLDVIFEKPVGVGETAKPPVFPREVNLCGGMFSGHGESGSFRGKVYDPFIQEAISTDPGLSLYSNLRPGELVLLAEMIKNWLDDNPGDVFHFQYELTRQEIKDLALTLKVFGEAGYQTYAWY